MQKKTFLTSLIGLTSLMFLSGCGESEVSNDNSSNLDTQSEEINIIKNDKLTIDENKCVGCGRCVKVASDNFEMNQNKKAQIKSNEIDSQNLVDRAIAICPVKAISQ